MKPFSEMKNMTSARCLAAILLSAAALGPVAAAGNDDAVMRTAGGVPYVSGGVGTDSTDRLDAMARDFNLKLVFALRSGDYVSSVKVTIADAAGKMMVDATSDGPWLLTKLPVGTYQVVATFAGTAERRSVAVAAGNLRTVDFRWASE